MDETSASTGDAQGDTTATTGWSDAVVNVRQPRRASRAQAAPAADDDAFAAVFSTHHAELLRLAYLLCGDVARADDLVAETFARFHRPWRSGRVDNDRAYLRRTLVNLSNSWLRRARLERGEARRRHGDDRGAVDAQQHAADRDEVYQALRRLPARQRTAIVLRYYEDLSVHQTAQVMGVSSGTVKASVSRGLATLRSLLADAGGQR